MSYRPFSSSIKRFEKMNFLSSVFIFFFEFTMFDIVLPSRGSTAYFGKFAVALFLRKATFFYLHLVSRAFS